MSKSYGIITSDCYLTHTFRSIGDKQTLNWIDLMGSDGNRKRGGNRVDLLKTWCLINRNYQTAFGGFHSRQFQRIIHDCFCLGSHAWCHIAWVWFQVVLSYRPIYKLERVCLSNYQIEKFENRFSWLFSLYDATMSRITMRMLSDMFQTDECWNANGVYPLFGTKTLFAFQFFRINEQIFHNRIDASRTIGANILYSVTQIVTMYSTVSSVHGMAYS